MLGSRNDNLIINICAVTLKSAWGNAFPELAEIFTSLSKIRWQSDHSTTNDGILYKNRLTLSYPGLNKDQFQDLDKFIRGLYEVRVQTEVGEKYQLAGEENPMEVKTSFNGGATEITLSHDAIDPIKYLGNQAEEEAEDIGFPYNLTFTLA
jgi:hypothetical protein